MFLKEAASNSETVELQRAPFCVTSVDIQRQPVIVVVFWLLVIIIPFPVVQHLFSLHEGFRFNL